MSKLKFFLYYIILMSFCRCSEDDVKTSDPYYVHMDGRYELKELYTDEPIDLDFDGIAQTDMRQELACQIFGSINFYFADLQYNNLHSTHLSLVFSIPNSEVLSESPPLQCFREGGLSYSGFLINKNTGDFTIVHRDVAREAEFGSLVTARYENRKLYLDVDKIIFTSEGWQTLPMHFVYEWHNP